MGRRTSSIRSFRFVASPPTFQACRSRIPTAVLPQGPRRAEPPHPRCVAVHPPPAIPLPPAPFMDGGTPTASAATSATVGRRMEVPSADAATAQRWRELPAQQLLRPAVVATAVPLVRGWTVGAHGVRVRGGGGGGGGGGGDGGTCGSPLALRESVAARLSNDEVAPTAQYVAQQLLRSTSDGHCEDVAKAARPPHAGELSPPWPPSPSCPTPCAPRRRQGPTYRRHRRLGGGGRRRRCRCRRRHAACRPRRQRRRQRRGPLLAAAGHDLHRPAVHEATGTRTRV